MATYYDNREKREKSIPDCQRFGLVWNSATQRCERPQVGPGSIVILGAVGLLIWRIFFWR